jgi:hypothetical protein
MTHPICDSCETVKHCSQHGCIPKQTTTRQNKSTKINLQTLLDQTPRLREWAAIGPVQRAELAQFVEAVLNSQISAFTYDSVGVNPGDRVWVLSSLHLPTPTTVKVAQTYTNYLLRGDLTPVSQSFSTEQAATDYLKFR